jgi:hypothetical protein
MLARNLSLIAHPLLSACVVAVHEETDEIAVAEAFDRVVVDLDSGSVTVTGDGVGDVVVAARLTWVGEDCPAFDARVRDGTLYVEGRCDSPNLGFCGVDVSFAVPPDLPVEVTTGSGDVRLQAVGAVGAETGSGDVEIEGAAGAVDVETGSGDVSVSEVDGQADVVSGSGNLRLDDVAGAVRAETGSGDVDAFGIGGRTASFTIGSGYLVLRMAGDFEQVVGETGSGDVDLTVPGGEYLLDVETDSGDVDLYGVQDARDAAAAIWLRSGSGDITVTGR